MKENQKSRAFRRRREREAAKEPDYGPVAPRAFDKCPVCGCPARFTVEAMKGDLHMEDILGRRPALGSFEYVYDTPLYAIQLVVIVDCCVGCGAIYTLYRDKVKITPQLAENPPGGGGPLIIGKG